ncbi:condensation domain-containing protein [Catenuloplanes indicus]|uniref:Condensation domain-containing protein n=1 Tax=Catenuloplanes indicus TaxID=137267 RepID=A0AAE3VV53_9ACTN|nr:condensation domain-containing protein [Catenuloplanes indicus]MDQ0363884.1 hypothetical protein [Catenuloplanes indicus]
MTGELLPLTPGQEAMWLLHRLAPDSAAYNIVVALSARGPLDEAALRRATAALAARHDVLRSRFGERDGVPYRVVGPPGPAPLTVRDDAPGAAERAARAPFRLTAEPGLRVTLLRRAPGDAVLIVVTHHIVSDATSHWLVVRDLLDAYGAFRQDRQPDWPHLPIDFDRYVRDELARARPAPPVLPPAAELPTDRPRPARPGFAGATLTLPVAAGTAAALTALALRLRVTPFAVLLGAFQAAVHRTGGQKEFTLGCPATTRTVPGLRDLVGYLVRTVPVTARLHRDSTLAGTVRDAHAQVLGAFAALRRPEPAGPPPGFRIAVTMVAVDRLPVRGLATGGITRDGLRLELVDLPHMEGQFDLNVELRRGPDSLTVVLRYDTELFDAATVARFGDLYLRMLDTAGTAPDTRVRAVPAPADVLAWGGATA